MPVPKLIFRSAEEFLDWIRRCEEAGGIPQIVEKYGRIDFLAQDMVLLRCWGAGEAVPGGLAKIPHEIAEAIREVVKKKGAYKYVKEILERRIGIRY